MCRVLPYESFIHGGGGKMKYLVLGASAAGINGAKTLRKLDKNSTITIISIDDRVYSRCMLHLYIGKKRTLETLSFVGGDFFQENNIEWIKNAKVIKIQPENKRVVLEDGTFHEYDKLLIATGSSAAIPPIENLRDGKNVFTLRNLEDAIVIDKLAEESKKALIIGGGLIGINVAVELIERGLKVQIVEMGPNILPMQLDERSAQTYQEELSRRGASILTSSLVEKGILDSNGNIVEVVLTDGTKLETDMVVVAAGVRANADFIEGTNIKFDRGIMVDDRCETDEKDIYAAGDVCANKLGIWPLAVNEGITAAYNMVGMDRSIESSFGFKNSMNFYGIPTISIGNPNPKGEGYQINIYDDGKIYKKIVHKDGIVYGAIFQRDISYSGVFTRIIGDEIPIDSIDKDIFDIGYGDFFSIKPDGEFEFNIV